MITKTLSTPPELYDYSVEPPILLPVQPTQCCVLSMEEQVSGWITFKVGLLGSSEEDLSSYADFIFSTSTSNVETEWAAFLAESQTPEQLDTLHTHCLESIECCSVLGS